MDDSLHVDWCCLRDEIQVFMIVVLGVEYHGAWFQGWQTQPNGCGVQDQLEHALEKIAGKPIRLHAAGRTDTGVHAFMQVAHFETDVQRPMQAWVRGCNAHLSAWVRVRWAKVATDDFHARYSALSRCYEYILVNQNVAPAIQHARVGWFHRPLDTDKMHAAAILFLGEHDFSAFRASECQAKSPIRTMMVSQVSLNDGLIVFRFQANGFLQHQIRNMVGALIYVGHGRLSIDEFSNLLAQKDRRLSPPTFMSDGLYFAGVEYSAQTQITGTLPDWAVKSNEI